MEHPINELSVVSLSNDDIQWLQCNQPGLSYEDREHQIAGKLNVSAEYDRNHGFLRIGEQPVPQSPKFYIRDTFEIEIRLQYQSSQFNPWPPVRETAGRVQQIMTHQQIADMADLHIYPSESSNLCCLGINASKGHWVDIPTFINEMVVPFFYRLSYVERHGLESARNDLWGEYSHGEDGLNEYRDEMREMTKTGRNELCPCGSGKKFKRCHWTESRDARF